MSNGFLINNPGVVEAHDILKGKINELLGIVDDLSSFLNRTTSEASQSTASAPWADLQLKWQNDHKLMQDGLETRYQASVRAHECFQDGDRQGCQIMLGG